jgi:hypothetical protein
MLQKLLIIFICIISAFILIYASSVESCFYQTDRRVEVNQWIGKSTNTQCDDSEHNNLIWSCPTNWSNNEIPKSNDIIVFDDSSLEDSYADISFQVYGMIVDSPYTGTITMADNEILKIGSEGLKMRNGIIKLGDSIIQPKDGELLITLANYKDVVEKERLVIQRVAFTCSDEVIQNLTNDVREAFFKPVSFFGGIFSNFSDQATQAQEKGINPIFNIINITLILLNIGFLFGMFKLRRSYGFIRDRISKEAIKFTPFKILLGASTNISYRGLSDIEGRYSFPVISGSYRIEVNKEGYKPYYKKINVNPLNIFTNYVEDIELEPLQNQKYDNVKTSFKFKWTYKISPVLIKFYPAILTLGIINLIYIVFGETNRLYVSISASIFIIYLFIYFINLVKPRPQLFEIVDSANGLRIPNVLVKLIDFETNKLIDTKITNHDGFFESAIHKGEYALFISHPGYIYPSKFSSKMKKVIVSSRDLLVINFKPNGSKKTIYLDPTKPVQFI